MLRQPPGLNRNPHQPPLLSKKGQEGGRKEVSEDSNGRRRSPDLSSLALAMC